MITFNDRPDNYSPSKLKQLFKTLCFVCSDLLFFQIGLSYQQKVRDGCTVTLSTNLDGTKLNQPGHKLGICLEMEA